jgi:hypothetical protein
MFKLMNNISNTEINTDYINQPLNDITGDTSMLRETSGQKARIRFVNESSTIILYWESANNE